MGNGVRRCALVECGVRSLGAAWTPNRAGVQPTATPQNGTRLGWQSRPPTTWRLSSPFVQEKSECTIAYDGVARVPLQSLCACGVARLRCGGRVGGRWREDGGGWREKGRGWRGGGRGRRVEGGGWRVEGGGWREEGGGWRVEGEGWRVEARLHCLTCVGSRPCQCPGRHTASATAAAFVAAHPGAPLDVEFETSNPHSPYAVLLRTAKKGKVRRCVAAPAVGVSPLPTAPFPPRPLPVPSPPSESRTFGVPLPLTAAVCATTGRVSPRRHREGACSFARHDARSAGGAGSVGERCRGREEAGHHGQYWWPTKESPPAAALCHRLYRRECPRRVPVRPCRGGVPCSFWPVGDSGYRASLTAA